MSPGVIPMRPRRFLNRRTFVAGSVVAGLGAGWVATSSSWTARFLRERFAEFDRTVAPAPHQPQPRSWSDQAITLAWLGHASVLINFLGVRILTDPAFFPRVGVSAVLGTLGPKRLTACALTPAQLPDIDLVIVSHAHFDHLDIPSLRAVPGRPQAVMARDTSDLLPRRRYREVQELRWGETTTVRTNRGEVHIRGLEVRHWGARVRRDTHRGYNGYILEREGRRLLFGGDTADTPLFREHRSHGPFEAAIMPIGAYDPWIHSHCTPEQAVAMANAAGARWFLPIHHHAFKLSNEPFQEPIERARETLQREPERLAWQSTGETFILRG
jgi:L-ascorbate metabolism protein UlaG (beta-lactamase superfamily)